MTPPPHSHRLSVRSAVVVAAVLALALLAPGAGAALAETGMPAAGRRLPASVETSSGAGGSPSSTAPSSTTETSTSGSSGGSATTTTTTAPAPEAPAGVHGQVTEAPSEAPAETPPAAGGGAGATETTSTSAAPEVRTQSSQAGSAPGGAGEPPPSRHGGAHRNAPAPAAGKGKAGASNQLAPPPSALTPPGWAGFGALGTPISGIPDFFIESFRVPPFLLPIYQAAGTAYDIPWQVLAAINEVETDYGRDLNVSSAGAEGWMQFLPSSWARYGVDANGSGYEDPYNPADAIFAAARYLQAAGGAQNIRAAVYAYNHSAAYVEAVMLRAQLLGGTPPELLSAITGLTESRFPVHAAAHFSDGFPQVGGGLNQPGRTLVGTVIYAQAGAPVIAVQDGQITAVGDSPMLGRYVSLRDAYGNTYTYAQLGSVAALYPVLEPRVDTAVSARIARPGGSSAQLTRPIAPASAGVQPHSPLSQGAVSSGLAMGAASALETPPAPVAPAPPPTLPKPPAPASTPRVFRSGPDEVYLHPLVPGVQVLAGTVLGHIGAASGLETSPVPPSPGASSPAPTAAQNGLSEAGAHMLFQIRPGGAGAPLIDPKPILDGWVRLEEISVFRAKGENPFLATSPTVGQVLLESKPQLEQLILRDPGVHLATCERGEVRAGEVDRRVLATLAFLSVSGLSPTVPAAGCGHTAEVGGAGGDRVVDPNNTRNLVGGSAGDELDISAIDGTPIAGHEGPGSVTDIAVRRLLRLQGTMKPAQIVSANSYPGTDNTLTLPGYHGLIHVAFASPLASTSSRPGARVATAQSSPLTPSQWLQLIAQIGEIPEPEVSGKPSAAAIPDPGTSAAGVSTGAADGSATPASPTAPAGASAPSDSAGGG
jgi:soluble lytic murein transglycosylase-like protein